ncbi:Lsr2 family DNA-binding protein [Glycomyces lechevalierae]|uniref:Lsr2 DNA-binding domain-containing protein n=1 Tax=Glycomyces lechevalierae TaxID=256034 RepID=A0ABU2AHZ8_9ACTN|nr:histone-like nucleoid-structuring protein Lsr2 [Glycomyces lechevalierae]MDR7336833.1 hypothetical protein [Glycomyces lechevalierae]
MSMKFMIQDSVRAGAREVGELWMVDRHLYLTEDQKRVVEEGDPEGRWLWAAPGRQVPLSQARQLGAVPADGDEPEGDLEDAVNAGVAADHAQQATFPLGDTDSEDETASDAGDDSDDEEAEVVKPEQKQAAAPENKMVGAPEGDKRPDAKTVRAWAKDNDVEVPAKGRIPDDVMDAYNKAH